MSEKSEEDYFIPCPFDWSQTAQFTFKVKIFKTSKLLHLLNDITVIKFESINLSIMIQYNHHSETGKHDQLFGKVNGYNILTR